MLPVNCHSVEFAFEVVGTGLTFDAELLGCDSGHLLNHLLALHVIWSRVQEGALARGAAHVQAEVFHLIN